MKDYSFFSYEVNEALHLSEQERGVIIEQGAPETLLAEGSNTRTRDFCAHLLDMGA